MPEDEKLQAIQAATAAYQAKLPGSDWFDPEPVARSIEDLLHGFGWDLGVFVSYRPLDLPGGPEPFSNWRTALCYIEVGANGLSFEFNAGEGESHLRRPRLHRLPAALWPIACAMADRPGVSGRCLAGLGDGSFWPSVCFSSPAPDACVVPDPYYFETLGYAGLRAEAEKLPDWARRTPKVFWRGSNTGLRRYWPPKGPDDLDWLQRARLCLAARDSPLRDHLDIGFSQLSQLHGRPDIAEAFVRAGLMADTVPRLHFGTFRYVVDIDGNSHSWAGLYCSFLLKCCVLKVDSLHGLRAWYYDRLKPWVHYVPVKADLSDFDEAVNWVLAHDAEAQEIALSAYRLAASMDFLCEMKASADRFAAWLGGAGH